MMTVEHLAFVLAQAYPTLARWRDYWVSHPVDSTTLEQIGPAWIPEWVPSDPPKPTDDDIARLWAIHGEAAVKHVLGAEMRAKRDALLAAADTLVMKMEDAGEPEKVGEARKYRQALRDVPKLPGFPEAFEWPVVPERLADSPPNNT